MPLRSVDFQQILQPNTFLNQKSAEFFWQVMKLCTDLDQTLLYILVLKWGYVFLKQSRSLGGIQFTTHFIDFFVVETKRFVCSFVNVILTRQTCGQRSSRGAESKRQALKNDFSEQICYMFLMSKCRED